jgi:uncharacterized low-complexity protein
MLNWRIKIMSKQAIRKPLSIALGAAIVSTLGAAGVANATETGANPFAMEELMSGYLTAGGHEKSDDEGSDKSGEGSCGDKGGEGSCGAKDEGDHKKDGEGKCGEGKCGGGS